MRKIKSPRFELVAEEAGWWKILSHGRWICGFHEDNADDASVSEVGELISLANEAWERKEAKADQKAIRGHKEQASKIRGIKLRRERFMMSVRCFGMHLKGMTNKEIAARLNRTPQTVRGHIDRFIKPHRYIHHRRGVCRVNSRWYQYESFHEKQGF